YGHTVDRFLAFCVDEKIPTKFQLPTDEFVLCAFAASGAGVHSGSTARNNIAALKAWHVAQDQPWLGGSRLHYVLAGVENLAPDSSKRAPRPPINTAMLRAVYDGLDFTCPRDVAVFAAACVAFWGQCRLGEILPISATDSALAQKPTRAHISHSHRNIGSRACCRTGYESNRNKHSTTLRIPRTKTKKSGDDVILVSQHKPLDPEIALRMHLTISNLPPSTPLFAYRTPTGFQTLTCPKFLQRCNEIWEAAGYPRTTGHSFRIGGTAELLLAGVAPDVVKAMGRWSSDVFHRYWRSLEDLAPLHASNIGVGSTARHSGSKKTGCHPMQCWASGEVSVLREFNEYIRIIIFGERQSSSKVERCMIRASAGGFQWERATKPVRPCRGIHVSNL
ncbi:hypothetical protein DFH08DRAFT_715846, partial [Mycena albidolilacea]